MLFRRLPRALCLAALLASIPSSPAAQAASPSPPAATTAMGSAMLAASQARHVPMPLLEAVAYVNTRWEWISTPLVGDGAGPMDVTPAEMSLAASLSGHAPSEIRTDPAANFDAGAALLAHYHPAAGDLTSWRPAVVTVQGPRVADQVYAALQSGATRTTSTGEVVTLAPQSLGPAAPTTSGGAGAAPDTGASTSASSCVPSPDYNGAPACWIPADPTDYSIADRGHDYPIEMIVIHDIEGSTGSAIQRFQTPNSGGSAHYVISYGGAVTQMVREKDIAWHAGNWDYNTRAIGIEHEGFAWTPGLYTTAEYNASAALAASICSRWGVPLDRQHVIGHSQVPDPNNPNLFGGSDHHTDPGPYWNWTYYMAQAQADSRSLANLPHVMPDPVATNGLTDATVRWTPARVCRASDAPVTGYTVTGQPGNLSQNVAATATSATFSNLQPGTTYTFTVTAHNSNGDGSATSNPATPGHCATARLATTPSSPQGVGTQVTFTATSTGCVNPTYEFWMLAPGAASYRLVQPYSPASTLAWDTRGQAAGTYGITVWARDAASSGNNSSSLGTWDTSYDGTDTIQVAPCTSGGLSATPASPSSVGPAVSLTASAAACPTPAYQFWMLSPGSTTWRIVQPYSTSPTFNWKTAGLPAGTYRITAWARDAASAGTSASSLGRWDTSFNLQYVLTAAPCTGLSVTDAPSSPSVRGNQVTFTATASGCPSPAYQFWMLAPGSSTWQLVRPYSTSPSFTWATAGKPLGLYRVTVWVRDASSAGLSRNVLGSWDYPFNGQHTLTSSPPCTDVKVDYSQPSPSSAGSQITITATATCPNPNPLYEFWMLAPGSSTWQAVSPYSTSSTYVWNTSGKARGTYRISIWIRDSASTGTMGNSLGTWDKSIDSQYSIT